MTRARRYLWCAAGCGLVHAAFSLYWAAGGRWLLDTVGRWALDWTEEAPATATLALLAVAAIKVAGAVVPLLADRGRLPWSAGWRWVGRIGGVLLVGYGAVNMVGAWAVLLGLVQVDDPDTPGLVGHAALWDPLFVAWGVFLVAGLRRGSARS